jgi:mRNA interferase RelE/StbE
MTFVMSRELVTLAGGRRKPPACTKLVGEDDAYRVCVGGYRIVYEVLDDRLLVHVVRVGHRRDAYRD